MALGGDDAAAGRAASRAPTRHRAHVPDAARRRRGLGAGERDDRRHDRRPGQLRRIAARLAAPPPDERMLREGAMLALAVVGLERLAEVRADRLQHSELRFMEIARALMLRAGVPAARRARRRTVHRRDRTSWRADQGDQPQRHRRASGRASRRSDLRYLRSGHGAQSRARSSPPARRPKFASHKEVVSAYLGG